MSSFILFLICENYCTLSEELKILEELRRILNSKNEAIVAFFPYDEGLCVQCMHIGSYDDEPATVDLMHDYMKANGYELDITDTRYHHEIYLSDPRKCDVSRLKTVVRHPIRKAEE